MIIPDNPLSVQFFVLVPVLLLWRISDLFSHLATPVRGKAALANKAVVPEQLVQRLKMCQHHQPKLLSPLPLPEHKQ